MASSQSDTQPICSCGLPMSENPHPHAGEPEYLLKVGAVWVCIPCTQAALHRGHQQKVHAEAISRFYAKADDITMVDEKWLRSIGAVTDESQLYIVIDIPGGEIAEAPDRLEWLLDEDAPGGVLYLSVAGTDVGSNVRTRGQVRRLLQALGIRSDVNWPTYEEAEREVSAQT